MQDIFEIKDEYKAVIVGFNKSGLPLGDRQDLHLLAEMAVHNPGLRKYFVQWPSPADVAAYKEARFLEQHPAVEETKAEDPEVKHEAPEEQHDEQTHTIETAVIDETTEHIV